MGSQTESGAFCCLADCEPFRESSAWVLALSSSSSPLHVDELEQEWGSENSVTQSSSNEWRH